MVMANPIRINTEDSVDYCYFPVSSLQVNLRIHASHDARIALRSHLNDDSDVYEILIGGRENTISSIKKNNIESNVVEIETWDILSEERGRGFWIQWGWHNGLLSVGRRGSLNFMTYTDKNPFLINYIGVSTACGAKGTWILEGMQSQCLTLRQQLLETNNYWVDYDVEVGIPRNAVSVSEDGPYIGRAHHRGSVTPGNIVGGICTLPWGGQVHEKTSFQILCGKDINWVKSWAGSVPLYALPGGETEDDYPLFIGRVCVDGIYHVGKIQPNHQVCYISLSGRERSFKEYETLVINYFPIVEWVGR